MLFHLRQMSSPAGASEEGNFPPEGTGMLKTSTGSTCKGRWFFSGPPAAASGALPL